MTNETGPGGHRHGTTEGTSRTTAAAHRRAWAGGMAPARRRARTAGLGPARRLATVGCLATAVAAAGCGTAQVGSGGRLLAGTGRPAACATTVRGVIPWRGRVVPLPLTPGPIVSRARAIAAARRDAGGLPVAGATARLTSWTEVLALVRASPYRGPVSPPPGLAAAPWQPVWAVLLSPLSAVRGTPPPGSAPASPGGGSSAAGTTPAGTGSPGTRSAGDSLPGGTSPPPGGGPGGLLPPGAELAIPQVVLVGAASGRAELRMWAGPHPSWFAALTDRDPALGGCPGGSTARLPFGVLTRDEEQYTVRPAAGGRTAPTKTSVTEQILKLTTVKALNHVDPSLYGGCAQQDCSLAELIWPAIGLVRAKPGRTLACLPPQASYPSGYQPKRVRQYAAISVPGNYEIDCTGLPAWVSRLRDLAPPAPGAR